MKRPGKGKGVNYMEKKSFQTTADIDKARHSFSLLLQNICTCGGVSLIFTSSCIFLQLAMECLYIPPGYPSIPSNPIHLYHHGAPSFSDVLFYPWSNKVKVVLTYWEASGDVSELRYNRLRHTVRISAEVFPEASPKI